MFFVDKYVCVYSSAITAVAKKLCWVSVTERFNNQAEFPRDQHTLNKKWDNLVQIHRSLFAEHLILLNKTGKLLHSQIYLIKRFWI